MTVPTHYLDLLLLSASAFPAGFSASLAALFSGRQRGADLRSLGILAATLASLVALAAVVRPSLVLLKPATPAVLLAAVLAGPCLLGVEYLAGALTLYASTGRWGRGVSLHAAWRAGVSAPAAVLITLVAVAEEVIYRQIWISLLSGFGAPWFLALVLSSAVYGMNHLDFGLTAVIQKTLAGAACGGLYLAGGRSLYAPVTAHVVENLTLIALAGRLRE
jgi:membrane protease YdiL (CAAX protease family)